MALSLTEEQQFIKDSAREFCSAQASVSQLRTLRDRDDKTGYDQATWQQMCELGWSGVMVPEKFGGTGLGLPELGVILEEAGRALSASPLLGTVLLGTQALLLGGNEAQQNQYLPEVVKGAQRLAVALEETAHHQPLMVNLRAEPAADGFVLNGHKIFVIDGMTADTLIVVARTQHEAGMAEGLSFFLVPSDAKGLDKTRLVTADSRAYANLTFKNVQVPADALLGQLHQGADMLESLLDCARTGIAAELLGNTERMFEMTLDYLKEREQFGVLIGSFQALKHRMADMFCELQLARSTVLNALEQDITHGQKKLAASASLCKAKMGEVARYISNEAIQMHGGIGMTDEHDIGFFLKRSRVLEHIFGNSIWHRNRYGQLKGY